MNPSCDISDLLTAAIEKGDSRELVERFNLNELNKKYLNYIYEKLGDYFYIEYLTSVDLAQQGSLISRVLHVLWGFIEALNIDNEVLCLDLAKRMLPVITDEHCNVKNMKTALHILNATVMNTSVLNFLLADDTLEGLLQILGRKVCFVGDYECQAAFIEVLYRIASHENRGYWINIWFPEPTARSMFSGINPEKFECSLRQLLNYINRNEPERRVFSFTAQSVAFGSFQLKKPKECDMWIDFNYDSQCISFYYSQPCCPEESFEYQEMWETIVIDYSSLLCYSIRERKAEKIKEVTLTLNSACYALSTSSYAAHPEFYQNEVTIVFLDFYDIYPHLEAMFGKEKDVSKLCAEMEAKTSASTDVINISNERADVRSEFSSQRKVSNISSPLCVDVCENEVLSSEFSSQRKVSNLTSPICIDACDNEDCFPDSDLNQSYSVFRKISESTETVQFAAEAYNSDDDNHEAENRRMELSKNVESRNENVISKSGLSREKSSRTSEMKLRSSNPIGSQKNFDKVEKGASSFSKEMDYSQGSSKFHRKKVRLYNLESAPVYDVPPTSSSNDTTSRENVLDKSHLAEPNKQSVSEKAAKPSDLRIKRKAEPEGGKLSGGRKRTKSLDQTEFPSRGQPINSFDDFPISDDDFQEQAFRDSIIKRKRKFSETASTTQGHNAAYNRKDEVLQSTDKKKPVKKQRKAAVKAMRRTKEILDRNSEAAPDIAMYDIIEEMDTFEKNSVYASRTFKRSLSKSGSDTHSSEVSWIKKRKSSLFESPKKNYSDWRKSIRKKKELSVEVRPHSSIGKIPGRKNSYKKKKESNKSDSNIDAKSFGFTELENYNLTIEKSCDISSRSAIKDIETEFCKLSKANVTKRIPSVKNYDDYNSQMDHSRIQFKNYQESISTGKKRKSASVTEVSNDAKMHPDESNIQIDCNDEFECDNQGNAEEHVASATDHVEGNVEESDGAQPKDTVDDVSGPSIRCCSVHKYDTGREAKNVTLQRYFESVSGYSEKWKESTESSLHKTASSPDVCSPRHNSKLEKTVENQVVQDENLAEHYAYEENSGEVEEYESTVKKNHESAFSPVMSEQSSSGGLDPISSTSQQVPQKVSMKPRTVSDSKSDSNIKLVKRSKSVDGETRKKRLSSSVKSSFEQEKDSKKFRQQKKSKDIKNRSFSSLCSQLTSTSMMGALKDDKWFQDITSLLSQNACNLSRKLLASVQVYYAEFIYKMSTLRENLVKTAKIFELPLSQDTCQYKLKSLLKSCKIVRLEVEKSLMRMRNTGKDYFVAEARDYRKLKKKQMKANQKYFQSMQKIQQNSIAKLEQKVLHKTNYFLKKLQAHVELA